VAHAAAERLVRIGRVSGAFGVRGEVRIKAYGEDPLALLRYQVMRRADGSPALTLVSGRAAKGELIAAAKELAFKEAADALRGLELYVERAVLPPPDEDEFYLVDLIGLRAETAQGAFLGMVKAVHNFGAGDILEIDQGQDAPALLVPFTREAVPEVRLAEGRLLVDPPATAEGEPPPA
jgi:16S rRNA processing protein RimM